MTDKQMREAVERLFSQEPDERAKQAVEKLTQGRSLDEWFTDIYLDVAEDDLMSFQEFRRVAERDKVSDDFLSGWVVVSREALRNLLRRVVRDGIGMTDNLDSVRTIVRDLNLKPNDPPIPNPFGDKQGELSLSDIEQARPEFRVEEGEKFITIWDDSEEIGIRFERGDILAQHRLTDIVRDRSILTTTEGMRKLDETRLKLIGFAREKYPREFRTEVH